MTSPPATQRLLDKRRRRGGIAGCCTKPPQLSGEDTGASPSALVFFELILFPTPPRVPPTTGCCRLSPCYSPFPPNQEPCSSS